MVEFQNIKEFIESPFGNVNQQEKQKMEQAYQRIKRRIHVDGYMKDDKYYLIHVKVPSETNPNQSYDVVILFFTDENSVKRELTLNHYYIKLFSNSPSFIFQYAVMYRNEGYLIDFLFDKMDKEYADVMPKKPKELSYDKSIYCACRYLLDDKIMSLSKMGIITKHRKTERQFFKDIKTFQDVKLVGELNNLDKKIDKELEENKRAKKERKRNKKEKKTGNINVTKPKKDTLKTGVKKSVTVAKKIKASKSTRKK